MADYSANHIIDMVIVLGECQNNYRAAARWYAERFPLRRHLSHVTIRALTIRARGGHLNRQRRRHEYDENNARVLKVLAVVHLDRQISSRTIEREIGIPRNTALRILRNLRYHAYHITLVQELGPNHIQMRIEFCHWALARIQQDQDFFRSPGCLLVSSTEAAKVDFPSTENLSLTIARIRMKIDIIRYKEEFAVMKDSNFEGIMDVDVDEDSYR
ncbi:PREDICTED: uncharacterized protein LOC106742991 [Dinoponera quadriceps]|uniref:Uncharacterized protein LOC106742991 n=1 Tax=Dinoponera quadriceps TaxID=609295 RepID=A0A6P3X0J8_DINQU|nr:PREDICTED: uncharacterized protein LOC106742991 [Dinoponera quadriceps]